MTVYTFQLRDGEVEEEVNQDLSDDLEALKIAKILAANFDVEVSCGGRFVARVAKGLTVRVR